MSPQQVRTATFKTVRKGWDPTEVTSFLTSVAESLEAAQNQSTAMEARARAAVARLQELTAKAEETPDQSEEISRALILAQRTADATIADAQAESERILAAARDEAASTIDSTREMSATLVEDARAEARRTADDERRRADEEVAAIRRRREELAVEIAQLEAFVADQRDLLRRASAAMLEMADRLPDAPVGDQGAEPPVTAFAEAEPSGAGLDAGLDVVELDPTEALERPRDLPVRGEADARDGLDDGVDDTLHVMAEEPLRLPVADTL